jgi:hypothetical protein
VVLTRQSYCSYYADKHGSSALNVSMINWGHELASPHLFSCIFFFLWEYLRSKVVYETCPVIVPELEQCIEAIPYDIPYVMSSLPVQMQECIKYERGHLQNVIFIC